MATEINEGDVMEGIFSIACALFIADSEINKAKLNALRTKIEPKNFTTGRVKLSILENAPVGKTGNRLWVELQMRLKSKSTIGAFGDDFAMYVQKSADIGKLGEKIDTLIKCANKSMYLKKLQTLKNRYIDTQKPENIKFTVIADGVEGEQTGGEIKGDIMVTLIVEDKLGRKILASPEVISFSVKSGSKTAANLSPYHGMLSIAEHFSVSYKNPKLYENVLDRIARTDQEKKAMNEAVQLMFNELRDNLVKLGTSVTDEAIEYIRKNVQGADQAFLVDIGATKIKEIPTEKFEFLRAQKIKLRAVKTGDLLKFVSAVDPKWVLFSLRLKMRVSKTGKPERKFYVETGNMLY